ncbi:hypothetical protein K443DRAFT_620354 [Laccaria amethystina LaAM-08-1]|uniref:Uncharacterized protein n=1 Tax=Laccaria amethystina LaAM-08-1 TaxID=1095629 RepID=A0A0C9XVS8_9AGAR|nr:hypothetical protein K443DRAFT_620354 [Laccaria amethystina LaAM-08-1]
MRTERPAAEHDVADPTSHDGSRVVLEGPRTTNWHSSVRVEPRSFGRLKKCSLSADQSITKSEERPLNIRHYI